MMRNIALDAYGREQISMQWKINGVINRIYYVHSNSASYTLHNVTHDILKDHLYVFPQSLDIHFLKTRELFDHTYFDFTITPPLALNNVIEIDVSKYSVLHSFLNAIDLIFASDLSSLPGYDDFIFNMFENLLFLIDKIVPINQIDDNCITSALAFIHNNYMNEITVKQISETIHMDETHFIRRFKRVMNFTPYQYIRNHRLSIAMKLLQQGVPIGDVAIKTGYSSISSFSNMIKQNLGISPSDFVQKLLEKKPIDKNFD